MTQVTTTDAAIVVAGGGTGGHVYPAIAVADELVARGHARTGIHFVGSARGLEATAVPAAGYVIDLLPGRGIRRSMGPRALVQNLRTLWETTTALVHAVRLLRRLDPAVVLGVGGYAAAPAVLAARLLRIPTVVHEQNAAPGLVNRIAVALGARAAVSLPGTALRRAVLTGNPVRSAIAGAAAVAGGDHDAGRGRCVGVFGGSLGARRINDATLDLAARWHGRADTIIRHVTGPRDYQRCVAAWGRSGGVDVEGDGEDLGELDYELVGYEDDMAGLYARADVVVTRAGAVTVAELAVARVPAVLVPLPGAPSDHQTANARALVDAGAAVLVPDAECDGERLERELDALLSDPERLASMRVAAGSLARPDAARRVADLVEEVGRDR